VVCVVWVWVWVCVKEEEEEEEEREPFCPRSKGTKIFPARSNTLQDLSRI
jgi:hypothetical protein